MTPETALRRIAARAIAAPGFDPGGIPAAQELTMELRPLVEELRAEASGEVGGAVAAIIHGSGRYIVTTSILVSR